MQFFPWKVGLKIHFDQLLMRPASIYRGLASQGLAERGFRSRPRDLSAGMSKAHTPDAEVSTHSCRVLIPGHLLTSGRNALAHIWLWSPYLSPACFVLQPLCRSHKPPLESLVSLKMTSSSVGLCFYCVLVYRSNLIGGQCVYMPVCTPKDLRRSRCCFC